MKTTTIRKIALSQLIIAPENVRKARPSAEDDASLMASIAAHGLKQNLGVYAGENNLFYVHAGGRRLRALQALAEAGTIEADYKVPCIVEDRDVAREMSLVENTMREAMHPADEYEAFAGLIDQGASEEDVASRFGVPVLHVRKRLKLARVAPEIVAQYRDGVITLETLMAFTLTDSHERQREVWEQIQTHLRYGGSPAHYVRQLLNETRVAGNSRLATLVGVERYEAAGGSITRDLFSDKDSIYFDDPGLLEELASQVLDEAAEELRKEWKWVEVMIDMPWDAARAFGRVYPEPVDVDPALTVELEETNVWLDDLAEREEDLSEEESAEYDRLMERAEELDELIGDAEQHYTAEAKAVAGCIVSLGYQGEIKVEAGLVKPEHIPSTAPTEADETDGTDEAAETDRVTAVRIEAPRASGGGTAAAALDPAAARRKENGLSAALADDLRAIRHQVLQAHLAGDFETAFDLNLYSMCQHVFVTGYRAKPIDLSITPAFVSHSANHLAGTVAEKMLEALKGNLRLDWLSLKAPEDFKAMCALKPQEKQALFAFATSHGLAQQLSIDGHANPVIESAGRRMNVDVAACWRPTAANYFSRVRKDQSLEAAREQVGEQWARDHADYKKASLAEAMEAAFSEDARERAGLTPDIAAQTGRWLPVGMAFAAEAEVAEAAASSEADTDAEAAVTDTDADGFGEDHDEAAEEEEVAIPAFLTGQAA